MSPTQVFGHDRILLAQMSFGVVFQTPHPRVPFASHHAFGHDGAGGDIPLVPEPAGPAAGELQPRLSSGLALA
jgi:hypothetical protein